ncbi:probable calcium-binding protein CML45 [Amaranthus tricolor]|uniref:probable calcium-binding protein CML45 n=1 Tax=Amaranthus tricolor TaxID=29722 RepID=UPI002586A494|nr:probable calcium-binding protein CML45 [Amaranthus tricolor]
MFLSTCFKTLNFLYNLVFSFFIKPLNFTSRVETKHIRPIIHQNEMKFDISPSEINMVMKELGIVSEGFDDEDKEVFKGMFGEEEPNLEEIWEAYKIFDVNNDGFIDAKELGRVLCCLGFLKEGLDIEKCKKMISGFDRDNDGLLDFNDFLKIMHTCL